MTFWVGGAIIGGSLISGLAAGSAADSAAGAQRDAANTASDTQLKMYNQTRDDQAPWRTAGGTAISQLGAMTQPGGQFMHQFDANDLKNGLAPNYDFQLGQGLGAVNNQASVTGGLVGGNALKGINDYAQNFAGNAYQQAYQNYNNNQTNIFNRLSSIAGIGQTSVGATGNVGAQAAGNIGSAQLAGGAAQAAGYIGQGNAISGIANGLSGAAGWYGMNNGGSSGSSVPSAGSYANNDYLTS